MPTYLVALVVGDVAQIKIMGDHKWDFNIYTRPSLINQAQYLKIKIIIMVFQINMRIYIN